MLSNLLKKKKDSVKYFNKPRPCGIFFRCLNSTPLTPVHPPTVLFWLVFHSIFFPCLSICHQSVGFVTSTYLWVCFPPSNCFVIYKAHTHTKSFSHTQQILLFGEFMTIILDIKAVHEPKNLFHRITILIHRSQIWTVFSIWPYFQEFVNLSQFSQVVLHHLIWPIPVKGLNSHFKTKLNSIELVIVRQVL